MRWQRAAGAVIPLQSLSAESVRDAFPVINRFGADSEYPGNTNDSIGACRSCSTFSPTRLLVCCGDDFVSVQCSSVCGTTVCVHECMFMHVCVCVCVRVCW